MRNNTPALIFECANAHGGDYELLSELISRLKSINYPNRHIKFQPFHPDTIALPDFSWYATYQELLLSNDQWQKLISKAAVAFDGVWLDIFDQYGVDVLRENLSDVAGLKLQASVLENTEVQSALLSVDLSSTKLMLNVSGHEVSDIGRYIESLSELGASELILQIGYQAYPTKIEDTGLQKVSILCAAFPGRRICIADHAAAEDDLASIVPLLGLATGCSLVEKHVCLDRSTAKYDHYSALEPTEVQLLANRLLAASRALNGPFVSESESEYLAKTIQVPVAKKALPAGSLISVSDVVFRRTAQSGCTVHELIDAQQRHQILSEPIKLNSTISSTQMRPARVGVVVACRMKSSRLKNKAILPIEGRASVERCLENCLKIPRADVVVLATSTTEEDSILADYRLDGQVKFWQGDPDDVIRRYLGACEEYEIDVIVRVTADCPVVSPEIAKLLLDHHFKSGADYTAAKDVAVGTACEIYNREALQRVVNYLGSAEYSEYMTWYMQNNQHVFKIELIDLPPSMIRGYRLTLDYPEDLEMFEKLFRELAARNWEPTLENVYKVLDSQPEIVNLNSHLTLAYKTDVSLIEKLNRVTKIGAELPTNSTKEIS